MFSESRKTDPFLGTHLTVPSNVAGEDFWTEGHHQKGSAVWRPIYSTFFGMPGHACGYATSWFGKDRNTPFYQAIKQGLVVLYRSIFDVVRNFLHDEAFGGEERVLGKCLKPDLLIVDDMGMKQLPKRSGEYLFEIIMRRYETRSTMMTSIRRSCGSSRCIRTALLPFRNPTAYDTLYFGGILKHKWTWSLTACPSNNLIPFCWHKSRRIPPMDARSFP